MQTDITKTPLELYEEIRPYITPSVRLGDEYCYNNILLASADAIFSIGVKYNSVKKMIINFKEFLEDKDGFIGAIDSMNRILNETPENNGPKVLAETVFGNKCRTSTNNGILKAEATLQFLNILKEYGINNNQDFLNLKKTDKANYDKLKSEALKIKGQSSGISFRYFVMLVGAKDEFKPDRMLSRFLYKKESMDESEISNTKITLSFILQKAVSENLLSEEYLNDMRIIDYIIWKMYSKN